MEGLRKSLKSVKGTRFLKKEFCEELLKHFSPDNTGKELFAEVYVRLLVGIRNST